MSNYSFNEYHEKTDFTRNNGTVHNTNGYALLGLIGELGEVVSEFVCSDTPDTLPFEELQALKLISEFEELAKKIEALKKVIRKKQVVILSDLKPSDKLTEELGGVYWYLNNLADLNGLKMADVAQANQEMLDRRFKANPDWMKGGVKTH